MRKVWREATRKNWDWEFTWGYLKALRICRPDVVLAEFGPTAVRVMRACQQAKVPLVAHFHGGFDVGCHEILAQHATTYPLLFENAEAIIAVSQAMQRDLIALGAPREKVHHIYYGIDAQRFLERSRRPLQMLVAVGQFIDFKAPHLTVLAFKKFYGRAQVLGCEWLAMV